MLPTISPDLVVDQVQQNPLAESLFLSVFLEDLWTPEKTPEAIILAKKPQTNYKKI